MTVDPWHPAAHPELAGLDLHFPGAPDLRGFEALARRAFHALPDEFRALCADVVVRVAEVPDRETLAEMGLDHPLDLLGLFRGTGLAHDGLDPRTGQFPNEVWLYRLPILFYWEEGEDTLEAVVNHVLVHEIGHHFGLSDEDMYAIDDTDD